MRLDPHDSLGVVAEVKRLDVAKAADEEPSADEQDDRERSLKNEEPRANARSLAVPVARAGLECCRHVRTSGLNDRRDAGEQSRDDRAGAGECKNARVG